MLIDPFSAEADAIVKMAERIVAERARLPTENDAPEPDNWLTEAEAAELAGITADAMSKHRRRKSSPASRTIHGRPMYRRSAVLAWIEHRERHGIVRPAGLGLMEGHDADA